MKCYICDRDLAQDEIKLHPEIKKWEPCGTCLHIISEVFDDGLDEDEITELLLDEWGDYLSPIDEKTVDENSS